MPPFHPSRGHGQSLHLSILFIMKCFRLWILNTGKQVQIFQLVFMNIQCSCFFWSSKFECRCLLRYHIRSEKMSQPLRILKELEIGQCYNSYKFERKTKLSVRRCLGLMCHLQVSQISVYPPHFCSNYFFFSQDNLLFIIMGLSESDFHLLSFSFEVLIIITFESFISV